MSSPRASICTLTASSLNDNAFMVEIRQLKWEGVLETGAFELMNLGQVDNQCE